MPISFDSSYEMYIEAVDGLGLHHRAWVDGITLDENGEPYFSADQMWNGSEGSIFDAAGNPLWTMNDLLYH